MYALKALNALIDSCNHFLSIVIIDSGSGIGSLFVSIFNVL
jgi:hypothetical protein